VLDTAACLGAQYDTRVVTSRAHDHFADDRNSCLAARPDIEVLQPWVPGLPHLLRLVTAARVVVCNTTYSLRPLATLTLSELIGSLHKTIVVAHTEPSHVDYNHFGHLPSTLKRAIVRSHDALCRSARATVTFSEGECARLRRSGNQRAKFLPMVLRFPDAYAANFAEKTKSMGPARVVGFAGELSELKGFDRALRLVDRLPASATLLVAGDGPLRAEAEQRAHARPPGTAELAFAGPTRPESMADFYRAIDVLIVPSRTESLGRVAVEAMVSGVGVLGSPVGGLAELLTRTAGPEAQIDFEDPVAAPRAVTDLLGNGDLRLRRATAARRRVLSLYEALPERWLALVGQVAAECGA
jgi:glycosyltransferase involved in cell wall biosynthesis